MKKSMGFDMRASINTIQESDFMNRLHRALSICLAISLLAACAQQTTSVRPLEGSAQNWKQLTRAATILVVRGEYDTALKKSHEALNLLKSQPRTNLADQAVVLSKMGLIHRLMYEHSKSEAYYLQSLRIREKVFGQDDPNYADSLLGLGLAYQNQQKHEESLRLLEWAMAIADKHLGPAHPDIDNYLVALASINEDMYQFDAAMPLRQRSVQLLTRIFGTSDKRVAEARWRLAIAARQSGKQTIATEMFDKSLSTFRELLGHSTDLADRMHVVAINLKGQHQYKRSESLLKDALAMRLRLIGFRHPEVINNLETLADLYGDMNKMGQSLEYRAYATKARNGIDPYK